VPPELQDTFAFEPGQFLTLRTELDGQDVRRSYSICSTRSHYRAARELQVGIRPMEGGLFSNWAATRLKAGDRLAVMPPDGRFTIKKPRPAPRGLCRRLGHHAHPQPGGQHAGGQRARQVHPGVRQPPHGQRDVQRGAAGPEGPLPDRLTLIHVLSRQAQEVPLLEGRIDAAKVRQHAGPLLPAASMDEVFICGPEAMIEATEATLLEAGVPADRIRTERFTSPRLDGLSPAARQAAIQHADPEAPVGQVQLTLVIDGKSHQLAMRRDRRCWTWPWPPAWTRPFPAATACAAPAAPRCWKAAW
jgi:ring-1,2-phenylacetyl-CoA epoxidase subunit PaaE